MRCGAALPPLFCWCVICHRIVIALHRIAHLASINIIHNHRHHQHSYPFLLRVVCKSASTKWRDNWLVWLQCVAGCLLCWQEPFSSSTGSCSWLETFFSFPGWHWRLDSTTRLACCTETREERWDSDWDSYSFGWIGRCLDFSYRRMPYSCSFCPRSWQCLTMHAAKSRMLDPY